MVKGLDTPLLGRQAATALQLVARLDDVSLDSKENVGKRISKSLQWSRQMEGEYSIVLNQERNLSLFLPKAHFPPSPTKGEGRTSADGTAGSYFKGGRAN